MTTTWIAAPAIQRRSTATNSLGPYHRGTAPRKRRPWSPTAARRQPRGTSGSGRSRPCHTVTCQYAATLGAASQQAVESPSAPRSSTTSYSFIRLKHALYPLLHAVTPLQAAGGRPMPRTNAHTPTVRGSLTCCVLRAHSLSVRSERCSMLSAIDPARLKRTQSTRRPARSGDRGSSASGWTMSPTSYSFRDASQPAPMPEPHTPLRHRSLYLRQSRIQSCHWWIHPVVLGVSSLTMRLGPWSDERGKFAGCASRKEQTRSLIRCCYEPRLGRVRRPLRCRDGTGDGLSREMVSGRADLCAWRCDAGHHHVSGSWSASCAPRGYRLMRNYNGSHPAGVAGLRAVFPGFKPMEMERSRSNRSAGLARAPVVAVNGSPGGPPASTGRPQRTLQGRSPGSADRLTHAKTPLR